MFTHTNLFLEVRNILLASLSLNLDIVVAIRKGNVFGTQFHLEKSGESDYCCLKKVFIYLNI